MKQTLNAIVIILLSIISFSCEKQQNQVSSPTPKIEQIEFLPNLDSNNDSSNKYVVVVLGYGYNDGFIKTSLLQDLDAAYGLAKDGGIIIPFVYPDDFLSYGYERISLLPNNIIDELEVITNEKDFSSIAGIITLGAPENTHYALAKIIDTGYKNRIFSIFSQDDIMGTEANSTLSIDYALDTTSTTEHKGLEEVTLSYPENIFPIISPLINASLNWDEANKNDLFIPALRNTYNSATHCDFTVYIDPQTKIRSKNHYILIQK